jgi:hypothetical protein
MRLAIAVSLLCIATAPPARAELFGIFQDGSQNDFLGEIDAAGVVTTRGSVLNLGGRIGGVSDADPETNRFFFVGAVGASSAMSIWSVDVETGDVIANPVISMTGFSSGPFCIRWDETNDRLLAIMSKTNGDETLATINPVTGATAAIGAGFATGGIYNACAFDPVGQRLYQVANPDGSFDAALFRINASTGAVVSNPTINTGLPLFSIPGFLAWDDGNDRVLGVVNIVPSSDGKVLVSINVTTGGLTILSDAIPAGGYSAGVNAFDGPSGVLYFLANELPANSDNALFGVDSDGDVRLNEVLSTDFVGLGLGTSFLVAVPEAGTTVLAVGAVGALCAMATRRRRSESGAPIRM